MPSIDYAVDTSHFAVKRSNTLSAPSARGTHHSIRCTVSMCQNTQHMDLRGLQDAVIADASTDGLVFAWQSRALPDVH